MKMKYGLMLGTKREKIMSKEKKTTKKSAQTLTLKGKLDISRSGMGFVIVDGQEKDVIVKPNDFNRAFNGDIVKVQIDKHAMPGKRVEGKILDVVERKQTEFIGALSISKNFAFFIADTEK